MLVNTPNLTRRYRLHAIYPDPFRSIVLNLGSCHRMDMASRPQFEKHAILRVVLYDQSFLEALAAPSASDLSFSQRSMGGLGRRMRYSAESAIGSAMTRSRPMTWHSARSLCATSSGLFHEVTA